MGSRPKDPNVEFAKRAKSVVDEAIKQQGVVTGNLQAQTGEFIGPGYETYAETVDNKIGGASGTTFPRYVEGVKKEFGNVTDRFTKGGPAFGPGLRLDFKPGIMGSESEEKTSEYLMALGNMFSNKVEEVGKSGSKRLFALPEQAQMAFTSSAMNPALENLRNAQYVNFAMDPPTIANDAASMYRNLYNYSSV